MTGRPANLHELIQALTNLPNLDPVERARVLPGLIDVSKTVLAHLRADAMLAATTGPNRITQVELANQLGVTRTVVTDAIKQARAYRKDNSDAG